MSFSGVSVGTPAYQPPLIEMVPRRGLEPPRLSPLVPETSASTNSATWASGATDIGFRVSPCQSLAAHDLSRKPVATFRDRALEAAAFRAITRSPPLRAQGPTHDRNSHRNAGHGVRRLGLRRPPPGARARARG